jgi:chromosomal replication initiation ATPase DnaA
LKNKIIPKIQYFPLQKKTIEKKTFENFNISENNIISVEAAKVVGYSFGSSLENPWICLTHCMCL